MRILTVLLVLLTSSIAFADEPAIGGYDVVAYFTMDKAVKGKKKISVEHGGKTFRFSKKSHKELFLKNPKKYLPKYGGHCAFAVAMKNAKVPSNPKTFKLYNGQLLLFFDGLFEGKRFNTKIPWNDGEENLIVKADKNWKQLAKKK